MINVNDRLCDVKMRVFISYVSVNCFTQVMNMYGDLVMDSVPDKVKTARWNFFSGISRS